MVETEYCLGAFPVCTRHSPLQCRGKTLINQSLITFLLHHHLLSLCPTWLLAKTDCSTWLEISGHVSIVWLNYAQNFLKKYFGICNLGFARDCYLKDTKFLLSSLQTLSKHPGQVVFVRFSFFVGKGLPFEASMPIWKN